MKRDLTKRARGLGRDLHCFYRVALLDLAMRAVHRLPRWLYGRQWLLGLLFSMMLGCLFSGVAAKRKEFKA
jgi:hypothetical protein